MAGLMLYTSSPLLLELPRKLLDAPRPQGMWSSLYSLRADFVVVVDVVVLDVLMGPGGVKSSCPWSVSQETENW